MRHSVATRHFTRSRTGGALLAAILVVVVLSGVVVSVFTMGMASKREVSSQEAETRALYLAESAISQALLEIDTALENNNQAPATVGTEAVPRDLASGSYWADIAVDADGVYWITATGASSRARRTVNVAVRPPVADPFDHAVFAGNSSGDANYELRLSGVGSEADAIHGDVFSGGDVRLDDDANVTDGIYAAGVITGGVGEEGVKRPIPDINGMKYEVNHDYDVAAMFAAGATRQSNSLGGTAGELPSTSPAHIFRLDPDDRTSEINGTTKQDFFLEDPGEVYNGFTSNSGSGHEITMTPGSSGKVFYIDGNLWVHNKSYMSARLATGSGGVQVTFVVRGNVYFSDDVVLADKQFDGVAFIAIEDSAEADSGNIYLGDPRFGTLEEMHTFLYAENNFYDHNLSATGSSTVDIYGNMTAGNHVAIQRDFTNSDGTVAHSRLTIDFDDRLRNGTLDLPGLPRPGVTESALEVVLWREMAE